MNSRSNFAQMICSRPLPQGAVIACTSFLWESVGLPEGLSFVLMLGDVQPRLASDARRWIDECVPETTPILWLTQRGYPLNATAAPAPENPHPLLSHPRIELIDQSEHDVGLIRFGGASLCLPEFENESLEHLAKDAKLLENGEPESEYGHGLEWLADSAARQADDDRVVVIAMDASGRWPPKRASIADALHDIGAKLRRKEGGDAAQTDARHAEMNAWRAIQSYATWLVDPTRVYLPRMSTPPRLFGDEGTLELHRIVDELATGLRLISLGDALFCLGDDSAVIHLRDQIDKWCRAVVDIHTELALRCVSFSVEAFPVSQIGSSSEFVIGAFVERASEAYAKQLADALNDRLQRRSGNLTRVVDVITVSDLDSVGRLVPTLTTDAIRQIRELVFDSARSTRAAQCHEILEIGRTRPMRVDQAILA